MPENFLEHLKFLALSWEGQNHSSGDLKTAKQSETVLHLNKGGNGFTLLLDQLQNHSSVTLDSISWNTCNILMIKAAEFRSLLSRQNLMPNCILRAVVVFASPTCFCQTFFKFHFSPLPGPAGKGGGGGIIFNIICLTLYLNYHNPKTPWTHMKSWGTLFFC